MTWTYSSECAAKSPRNKISWLREQSSRNVSRQGLKLRTSTIRPIKRKRRPTPYILRRSGSVSCVGTILLLAKEAVLIIMFKETQSSRSWSKAPGSHRIQQTHFHEHSNCEHGPTLLLNLYRPIQKSIRRSHNYSILRGIIRGQVRPLVTSWLC